MYVALIAAVPACSSGPDVHPDLVGSGGTVTATAPAIPCDASGPLGEAKCAAERLERVVEVTAEHNANRSPWEKFTDRAERAFGRMGDAINPAVIAGFVLLALGVWLAASASGRVPALAPGRSDTGPAAGLRAIAVGRKALAGGWTMIAGAVIAAAAIGNVGGVFLTVVASALAGWGLVARAGTLSAAAKGFTAAEADYQQRVAAAQATADAEAARAAAADPDAALGLNLAAEPPRRVTVSEPSMSIAEAAVYTRTGGVGIAAGSATAALLDGRGRPGPAVKLWHAACEAAKVGTTDDQGNFTPAASLDRVVPLEGGDAMLVVIPASAAVGDAQLRAVAGPLLRVAGIRSAGAWEWDGRAFSIRLSNTATPPTAGPKSAPKATPADDDWV